MATSVLYRLARGGTLDLPAVVGIDGWVVGLGKQWVRAPRLTPSGAERKAVLKIIHDGLANRPKLPKRK